MKGDSESLIGRTLSHYAIEERLGEGGMGTVYLARDTLLGRRLAIKVVCAAKAADPALTGRLLREARAASNLSHPNIVTVYEIGSADGVDFIAMELVDGVPLSRAIPAGGLPVERVLDYAGQIAGAVAAAHAHGVVHRDLKPGNVIVSSDGRVKVLDFGLAKTFAAGNNGGAASTLLDVPTGATAPGAVLGTPGYMSPEQVEGRPADARSDVFSLGVVLFEMLTGRRPFTGDSTWAVLNATVHASAPAVEALRADVPPPLARAVARCLARSPDDRFASAAELAGELALLAPAPTAPATASRRHAALLVAAASALAVVAVAAIVVTTVRASRARWARETAVAQAGRLATAGDLAGSHLLLRRALEIAPDDAAVKQAWANLTVERPLDSEPQGAEIAFRSYTLSEAAWVPLGVTPLPAVRLPVGMVRWRLTKPGHDPLEVGAGPAAIELRLIPSGTAPPGMVLVPRGSFRLESSREQVELPDYWLDRHEVTNREFKAFVDAGGYRRRELWREPFVKEGRTLTWEAAMAELRDPTGRPGPTTWQLGTYPEGRDDHPVGGVSWYEAAAYAVYAGKQLPTVYHWFRAAGAHGIFSDMVIHSTFAASGPTRVGSAGGLGPFGTEDMAGNVKEWCANPTSGGRRYLLGGGWDEPAYMFRDEDAQSPLARRATSGFRCMLQREPLGAGLTAEIKALERDPASLRPIGKEALDAYMRLYDYDPLPLAPEVVASDDTADAWHSERVSIGAAYGGERFTVCLFRPRVGSPPYQAVVYFPGADALRARSSQYLRLRFVEYIIRTGRMLVFPIYQGTYERQKPGPVGRNTWRERTIQCAKDLRRTIDYLETRRDVDAGRVAFCGLSHGAHLAPIFLAVEPRLRTGVLLGGGLGTSELPPEVDPVNFAPAVRMPVLMVNGREDFTLPYETAQVPLLRLIGAPEADKRHVVFPGGHVPSDPQEMIKVVLAWLDERLGPVG